MIRLAVYLVPDADSPLYRLGTSIVGWDVRAEREVPVPAALAGIADRLPGWVGEAHRYGFHATIGDALDYSDHALADIEAAIAEIAAATQPFMLVNGRIHRTFRAVPRVLVSTFDSPDGAVQRLEDQVVTRINVRHERSPNFGPRSHEFAGLALEQFYRYGSPMVRSLFDLHFSLATNIPDAVTWHLLANLIEADLGLFQHPAHRTQTVTELHLLDQRKDGRYRIRRSFPLGQT